MDVGTRVRGRFGGFDVFYPGRITRKRENDTFDIHYDDGEFEAGVPLKFIQPIFVSAHDATDPVCVGQTVEARCDGESAYFRGRITRRNSNGSLCVRFDDGGGELGIEETMVRPVLNHVVEQGVEICEGSTVVARFAGRSTFVAGRVKRVRANGTFDIVYRNGSKECGVPRGFVRLPTDEGAVDDSRADDKKERYSSELTLTSSKALTTHGESDDEQDTDNDPSLISSLRDIFDEIDSNTDGVLNVRELIFAVRRIPRVAELLKLEQKVQEGASRDVFEAVFQQIDSDGSRDISWSEFVAYFSPAHRHRLRHYNQLLLEQRQQTIEGRRQQQLADYKQ